MVYHSGWKLLSFWSRLNVLDSSVHQTVVLQMASWAMFLIYRTTSKSKTKPQLPLLTVSFPSNYTPLQHCSDSSNFPDFQKPLHISLKYNKISWISGMVNGSITLNLQIDTQVFFFPFESLLSFANKRDSSLWCKGTIM